MTLELTPHILKHPNDPHPPPGHQLVRVDMKLDAKPAERIYVAIATGYGERARALHARGGRPNIFKLYKKWKREQERLRGASNFLPPVKVRAAKPPTEKRPYHTGGRRAERDLMRQTWRVHLPPHAEK